MEHLCRSLMQMYHVLHGCQTTHCPTFFILSTADLSQRASIFVLRVTADVDSSFRQTDRDGLGLAAEH